MKKILFIITALSFLAYGQGLKSVHNPSLSLSEITERIRIDDGIIYENMPPSNFGEQQSHELNLALSRLQEFMIDTTKWPVPDGGNNDYPDVAFDGTNYLVVWQKFLNTSTYQIYGTRVTQDGSILDIPPIRISGVLNTGVIPLPSVAFDGINYLVVWADGDIYGNRITTTGQVLDGAGIPICTNPATQVGPRVAFGNTSYFVIWLDQRNGNYDIYGARIDTSGVVIDTAGFPICWLSGNQIAPSISFDGNNYFIVWANDSSDLYGTRVSQEGAVIDTTGILITNANNPGYIQSAVSFDGSNYLVVWRDTRNETTVGDIYGARVTPNGVLLDSLGIEICKVTGSEQDFPDIAFDGINYHVAWRDFRNGYANQNIYGTPVSPAGNVLYPNGLLICGDPSNQGFGLAIAAGDTNYLSVWRDDRSNYNIYGCRVSLSGSPLDPQSYPLPCKYNHQIEPDIAFDGTNYLAVWIDNRKSPDSYYGIVMGARITPTGEILDPGGIVIDSTPVPNGYPAVAFDGTNYLVVWFVMYFGQSQIYGKRVSPSGSVLDPNRIQITTGAYDWFPAVAFDGVNYLVTWQDAMYGLYGTWVTPSGTVLNSFPIWVGGGPLVGPFVWFSSVAFGSTNYLVSFARYLYGGVNYDIWGATVTTGGAILDTFPISTAQWHQYMPDVTYDGTNFFTVWYDGRSDTLNPDIYGARVTETGTVIDPSGICISNASGAQSYPSVIYDGADYLVVWQDGRNGTSYDIYGAKIDTSGVVIDTSGMELINMQDARSSPRLAKGSSDTSLIVYQGYDSHLKANRIFGVFYSLTGIKEGYTQKIPTGHRITISPNISRQGPFVLSYSLPRQTEINVNVYDITGRMVKNVYNGNIKGTGEIKFTLEEMPQGIYFVRVQTENITETVKVIWVE